MLNTFKRTMRVPRASGLIATIAIWGTASVWAQRPANESAKLTASDAALSDILGGSVSLSGDTAILGARHVDDDCPSPNPPQIPSDADCGAAYIFQVDAEGIWVQVVRLTAADAEALDEFGNSVSLSGDTAIVGAHRSNETGTLSGSAYIFRRDFGGPNNWGQVMEITGSDTVAFDNFGRSVLISGDTAIVGATFHDHPVPTSGSAYIFQRDAGGPENWGQVAELTAADAAGADFFGWVVSLSGDTAIVGAWADDDDGIESGSAYIFQSDFGGPGNWGQVVKLTASDAAGSDSFGWSVSISGDTAFIGAPGHDDQAANSGAAYIFQRDLGGADNWGEVVKLTASDAAMGDGFANAVSISGDIAIAGATGDDDGGHLSGSAYVFRRDAGGRDNWGEVVKLTATDAAAVDAFGAAVALDGQTAVVGAPWDDEACPENPSCNSGSAYIFVASLSGPIVPIDQERHVQGFVIVPHCGGDASDGDEANGFEFFDGVAEAVLGCSLAGAAALASQQSGIGASSLTAAGTSYSEASAGVPDTIHAIAASFFEVTFELPSPGTFLVAGMISAENAEDPTIGAFAEVRLTAPDNETVFEHTLNAGPGEPESEEIEETGTLDAGIYTFRAQAATLIDNDVPPSRLAEASFDLAFDVATGDIDGDADVDLDDFGEFQDCLSGPGGGAPAPCHLFDFDFDNDVDWADFGVLQLLFRSG